MKNPSKSNVLDNTPPVNSAGIVMAARQWTSRDAPFISLKCVMPSCRFAGGAVQGREHLAG
jgi:hypothetical protein